MSPPIWVWVKFIIVVTFRVAESLSNIKKSTGTKQFFICIVECSSIYQ